MVAPNGARLQKSDHPNIPISIEETINSAIACHAAGADGIHAHIRNKDGQHILDVGLYRELLDELSRAVPEMYPQITTEAVGKYSPDQQVALLLDLQPPAASIALRELLTTKTENEIADIFVQCHEQGTDVQHILYEPQELDQLLEIINRSTAQCRTPKLLFILGRYTENQQSDLSDLSAFLDHLSSQKKLDWAVCAFGINETKILKHSLAIGGKVRIGFENNIYNEDGTIAGSNQERVSQLRKS